MMVGAKTVVSLLVIFVSLLLLAIYLPGALINTGQGIINFTNDQFNFNQNAETISVYYSKNYLSGNDIAPERAAPSVPPEEKAAPDDVVWVNEQALSEPVKQWLEAAKEAATQSGVPACQLLSHVKLESNGDPLAVGYSGEIGIAQVMPQVAYFDFHMKVYDPDGRIAKLTPGKNAFSSEIMSYLRTSYVTKLKKLIETENRDLTKLSVIDTRFDSVRSLNAAAALIQRNIKALEKSLGRDLSSTSWEVIAAYNAGAGSVKDARTFENLNPNVRKYVDIVNENMFGANGYCVRPTS